MPKCSAGVQTSARGPSVTRAKSGDGALAAEPPRAASSPQRPGESRRVDCDPRRPGVEGVIPTDLAGHSVEPVLLEEPEEQPRAHVLHDLAAVDATRRAAAPRVRTRAPRVGAR